MINAVIKQFLVKKSAWSGYDSSQWTQTIDEDDNFFTHEDTGVTIWLSYNPIRVQSQDTEYDAKNLDHAWKIAQKLVELEQILKNG